MRNTRNTRAAEFGLVDSDFQPVNWIYGLKVLCWMVMIAIGSAGCLTTQGLQVVPFVLLLGLAFAHGVELQHQALHWSGFTSRRLNRLAGFLLGLPMLVSFSAYQVSHLHHHELVGTPDDKEFFDYGNGHRPSLSDLLVHFLIINHYMQFARTLWRTLRGEKLPYEASTRRLKAVRLEYLAISSLLLGLVVLSAMTRLEVFLLCWLVPLVAVAGPVHAVIELPEHFGCDRTTRNVFQNTRTIKSNRFMTWFTNGNNYHVEHHLVLNLPIEKLPKLHKNIYRRIGHKNRTYQEFFRSFFKRSLEPPESQHTVHEGL